MVFVEVITTGSSNFNKTDASCSSTNNSEPTSTTSNDAVVVRIYRVYFILHLSFQILNFFRLI